MSAMTRSAFDVEIPVTEPGGDECKLAAIIQLRTRSRSQSRFAQSMLLKAVYPHGSLFFSNQR